MNKNSSFGLRELADLVNHNEILLPTVQRGFVWKPSQIENLWDSLLRGYPIGAIVLSPQKNDTYSLLDGQQRLTAICLGLGRETFRDGTTQIRIFIDLALPTDDDDDPRKYVFRVITRSHPWGYQRKDNTKTLDQASIRKALELYIEVDDPMASDLSLFFPYDAKLPIPFSYFVDATTTEQVWKKAASMPGWQEILNRWWHSHTPRPGESKEALAMELIKQVFNLTRKVLNDSKEKPVPALYLDFDTFNPASGPQIEQDEKDEEALDEIENLFVRLNAGGTPLGGEELNYSILKSHIESSLQEHIEKSCYPFYDPARFITIAYRLFQSDPNKGGLGESMSMRVKPKQFQRAMTDKHRRGEFVEFLQALLDSNAVEEKSLLGYTKQVLTFNSKALSFGLPYPVAARLSDRAPEIVFLLLYRIWFMKDRFDFEKDKDKDLHRKMLGVISLLTWLGKESGKKGYRRLLSNVWPAVKVLPTNLFWSSATIRRGQIEDVLPQIPGIDTLKGHVPANARQSTWTKYFRERAEDPFMSNVFSNQELILFAQRKFISECVNEEVFHLSDTNDPFDWDHIFAQKFIKGKRGIPQHVKDCYNMIGNFRAWPYSLNRIDQDDAPNKKLDPLNERYFDDSKAINQASLPWKKFLNAKFPHIKVSKLTNALCEWSFCDDKWRDCEVGDLRQSRYWIPICQLIVDRNLALCANWYKEFKLEELIPDPVEFLFEHALNIRQWKTDPDEWNDYFDFEAYSYRLKKIGSLASLGIDAYLYIGIPRGEEDGDLGILAEEAVEFGVFQPGNEEFIGKLSIPDNLESRYEVYSGDYVQGKFTLVSDDEASYRRLFGELWRWLDEFPLTKNKKHNGAIQGLADEFQMALKNRYRADA
ncbi:hypothetical protein CCR95_16045 [Thiocystis minor]|uniref:DUF262 domain-containing protein n=1 Tax=Thiocystis minor TaxID=61597 RepID=UPI0019114D10|nr:DUF262 domain-containing protein [Thiocystis minor]MBK5965557.1 hypothetical protein [Thiocystis minor]